jgi:hypothetical protein
LEVEGVGSSFDVEQCKRLVLVIEEDGRVEIMHTCGSYVKCIICRIEFLEGEHEDITESEMILDICQLLEAPMVPNLPGPHHGGQAGNDRGRHRRQRLRRQDAGGDHTRADIDRERLIERSSKTRATLAPRSLVAYHQRHEGAAGDSHERQLKGVRR